MRDTKIHLRHAPLLALAALTSPSFAAGQPCEALARVKLAHTEITVTQTVPAGIFKAPEERRFPDKQSDTDSYAYDLPAFCRVHGISRPTSDSVIHFEVWLPKENWTGRFHQLATPAASGWIYYHELAETLRMGAVAASTDDGHDAGKSGYTSWASGHPEKVIDWGNRAQLETANSAKVLIRAYYGRPAQFSYLSGCSGGGRSAMKAAQINPSPWDGILAGAPSMGGSKLLAYDAQHAYLWLSHPMGRIPPGKLPAIRRAELAACTPQAQLVNEIPGDPRFCRLDPAALLCKDEDNDQCLTPPQVETLRALYAGPRNPRTGEQIHPGVVPTAINVAITGKAETPESTDEKAAPVHLFLARSFYRDVAEQGSKWDLHNFDLDTDVALFDNKPLGKETLGSVFGAYNPDLSAFSRKGKLILYYGWVDQVDNAEFARQYYEKVAQAMGGLDRVRDFFRLLLIPGGAHCAGGEGANAFGQVFGTKVPALANDPKHNIARALEAWVEQKHVPDVIAAKFIDDDPDKGVAFTRPLCAYPQVLKYKGTGSVDIAENFTCTDNSTP